MKMMKRLSGLALAIFLLGGCVIYQRPVGYTPGRDPFTAQRLIEAKQSGTTDNELRKQLAFHGVEQKLTADDLVDLKEAGAGEALLTAAAEAPVKTPEEPQPIYERHSHRRYSDDCDYCEYHAIAPFYFATAIGFNYVFGRHWRCR